MAQQSAQQTFTAALDTLVAQVKEDRSILAAMLCGSLSHDAVWAKSDIDLVLITIDDSKVKTGSIALYADGVNVHALLVPRTEFRRMAEGSVQNTFMHSFFTRGRLLYTHDDTIARLWEGLQQLGARDREIQLLRAATNVLPPLYKAHKFLVTRGDLDYTALWILHTASSIAAIELLDAGQLLDREVIPRAAALNPDLFKTIYTGLLNARKTRASVEAALHAVDRYVAERATRLFAPVMAYLEASGDARSCVEIEDHFRKHLDVPEITTACEYLADQGLIEKVSLPSRLTRKSTIAVQELAFVRLTNPAASPDAGPPDDEEWKPR